MKNLKILFFALISTCFIAWILTGDYLGLTQGYFIFRTEFIQLTGLIALCAMSLDMVLALRPVWIENKLHGLDKTYRLHKWFGITAFVTSILHWLLAKGTKWAVGWGWLIRPAKNAMVADAPEKTSLELLFLGWKKNAEFLGEWAFYVAVILCIIALIKLFPYRFFRNFHTIFVGVYLIIAFHTVVLTKFSYWTQPFGFLVLILLFSGSISAVMVLCRRFGWRKQYHGMVIKSEHDPATNTLALMIRLNDTWPGHNVGQFAFLTLDGKEGAHPYTIASPWSETDHTLTFMIKGLGDYTKAIQNHTYEKQHVQVEGPYGRFYFNDKQRQIWIGAGIGITPFLARLIELQKSPKNALNINFIYVVSSISAKNNAVLQKLAQSVGVDLTIWVTPRNGRLNGEKLINKIPDWKMAEIWFCGPAFFGKTLEKDLSQRGFPSQNFYRELFDMR